MPQQPRARFRRLKVEGLESRDLLAIYLPDAFAHERAQPVAAAYNGGEQMLFTGASGKLQFGYGQSNLASSYNGANWDQVDVYSEVQLFDRGEPIGRADLYSVPSTNKQYTVYRTAGNSLVRLDTVTWQGVEYNDNLASDPLGTGLNGGHQITYIDGDNHLNLRFFSTNSEGRGDLNEFVGVGPSGDLNAEAGVAAFQVGSVEYFIGLRPDGALGVYSLAGGEWHYASYDFNNLPHYQQPDSGQRNVFDSVTYDASGRGGTANVGWVFYKSNNQLAAFWILAGQQPLATNAINPNFMQGVPSAEYDPVAKKVSVAFFDTHGGIYLVQESPDFWRAVNYHGGGFDSIPSGPAPLPDPPPISQASRRIAIAGGHFRLSAVAGGLADGTVALTTDLTLVSTAGATAAAYDSSANDITVQVGPGATVDDLVAALDALDDFDCGDTTNGTQTFFPFHMGTRTDALANSILTVQAPKPQLYWRAHTVGGIGPSLHIVYKDEAGHVQNFRTAGQAASPVMQGSNRPLFDTTAFKLGYRTDYGYGVVNAARAVAYALGQRDSLTGGSATGTSLDQISVPDAWTVTTGQNTAVFVIDSGVDSSNLDLPILSATNRSSTSTPDDTHGHGTAMAGLIAAANDGNGITGVAYDADIVSIKVGNHFVDSEPAVVNAIADALNFSLPGGYASAARVINMGFGYSFDSPNPQAVLTAIRNKMNNDHDNAVLVVPAGNRDKIKPDFPANFNVGHGIVAGALTGAGQRWSPSGSAAAAVAALNYLFAPGVSIYASTLVGSSGDNHNTASITGTSAAAAHISGVAALMQAANPSLTARQIESILIASADPLTTTANATPPNYPISLYWAGSRNVF